MFEKFKNKKVKVLVAFAYESVTALPANYKGVFEEMVDYGDVTFMKLDNYLINVKYIIDIEILD